jgi:hypothetical protein
MHSKESRIARQDEKPIVIQVESMQGRPRYTIESKPAEDLLRELGQLVRRRGEECQIVVLIDWNLPLRTVTNTELVVSKAGFRNIRSFVFGDKTGYMSEIKFGPGVPFSMNPALE